MKICDLCGEKVDSDHWEGTHYDGKADISVRMSIASGYDTRKKAEICKVCMTNIAMAALEVIKKLKGANGNAR